MTLGLVLIQVLPGQSVYWDGRTYGASQILSVAPAAAYSWQRAGRVVVA